ncbi:MAG: NUDIX domain-containing protein [Pirellulales bacterium]
MLQQTTVAAVRPAFERFLTRFPNVAALAAAEEAVVLRHWEGLGYYRRARQLHAAAQAIVAEHGGRFPTQVAAIHALPGIGRYTSGAIASIAFDLPAPILEANTIRLWARLLGETRDVAQRDVVERLWRTATDVLPADGGSGLLNQALMDLGSQVCLPREPLCLLCPVSSLCSARKVGKVAEIPLAAKKTAWTIQHDVALIIRRAEKVLLVRYAPGARWAGMWDTPRATASLGQPIPQAAKYPIDFIAEFFNESLGITATVGEHLGRLNHVVTRYKITLDVYEASIPSRAKPKLAGPKYLEFAWVKRDDLADLPMSTTVRRSFRAGSLNRAKVLSVRRCDFRPLP